MRAVLQRVSQASVLVEGSAFAAIGPGLLLLLGVEEGDTSEEALWLAGKVSSMRIFDDIDFSKLPAPNDVLIENIIAQGKEALTALKFKTIDNGKLFVSYYVRSEMRQKDKAYHAWSVTLPIGDGKKGKTVNFKNGEIDTISNSTIYGG